VRKYILEPHFLIFDNVTVRISLLRLQERVPRIKTHLKQSSEHGIGVGNSSSFRRNNPFWYPNGVVILVMVVQNSPFAPQNPDFVASNDWFLHNRMHEHRPWSQIQSPMPKKWFCAKCDQKSTFSILYTSIRICIWQNFYSKCVLVCYRCVPSFVVIGSQQHIFFKEKHDFGHCKKMTKNEISLQPWMQSMTTWRHWIVLTKCYRFPKGVSAPCTSSFCFLQKSHFEKCHSKKLHTVFYVHFLIFFDPITRDIEPNI